MHFYKIYTKKIYPRSYDSCTYLFIYTLYSNPKNKIQRTNNDIRGCSFFLFLFVFLLLFFFLRLFSIHTAALKQPCNDNFGHRYIFLNKKNFPLSSDTRPAPLELCIFTKKKKKRKIFQTHKPFHHYFSFTHIYCTIYCERTIVLHTYTLPFTFWEIQFFYKSNPPNRKLNVVGISKKFCSTFVCAHWELGEKII